MRFPDKTFLISDPLHGSIQISELEKQIISTEAFNRLHHILQNSTVYLTFPSNKTSRFLHSIGVMYLGGEMFKYGITNGVISREGVVVKEFMETISNYLSELKDDKEFNEDLEKSDLNSEYQNIFGELNSILKWDEPFYNASIPHLIGTNGLLYPYVVTLQALRCAALLHDVGHPPFSHISEKALENIYLKIQIKEEEGETLTARESYFLKTIKPYFANDKLHERIGKHLSLRIFDRVIENIEEQDRKVFYLHVKHLTNAILLDKKYKKGIFKALHGIVDGEIDCDRLDYVSRDTMVSGINDGAIEYPRIYKSMKLLLENENYLFCPSSHISATIEDYLNRRLKMYKHIILHHRVVKTDTLLRVVIEQLAENYLSGDAEEKSLDSFRIPNDISGLWKVLDEKGNPDDIIYRIIQWDDAWLLACLRTEYFSILSEETGRDSDLLLKLEELLSNKKNYTSLYKRADGFEELDNAILENISTAGLSKSKLLETIEQYKSNPLLSKVQLFSNVMGQDFEKDQQLGLSKLNDLIEKAIRDIIKQGKYSITKYIFQRNKIKIGVGEANQPAKIHTGEDILQLAEYSNIKSLLSFQAQTLVPYYVYLYSENELDLSGVRQELGKAIAKEIQDILS
ncbi:HD domain-containing protein [Priestia aryabhattai]|uniref:HD domain-containing protein n=1 Tax=Priestia aryabhattai TaxID=412384 RepID=UPI00245352DF|nr:HD domain-containing protein [Priestia aryabhattai]MDH3111339.1 HD domain-containing protein [Priestia aryabhattai]MDH3129887.1 HD domain-containing protein [Priestia aryabhattai]